MNIPRRESYVCFVIAAILLADASAVAQSEIVAKDGFTPLFDGKTLDGWVGATNSYEVIAGGILRCKRNKSGNLFTERSYRNFELEFEFCLTPGANNGLAIRSPVEGDPAYVGIELQILDNTAEKFANLNAYQYHGSAYGIAAAERGHLRPVGEWNQQRVRCVGRAVQVWLNGKQILKTDLDKAAPSGKTLDGRAHPGLKRTAGRIGLLGHGDQVDFRGLRIREIK